MHFWFCLWISQLDYVSWWLNYFVSPHYISPTLLHTCVWEGRELYTKTQLLNEWIMLPCRSKIYLIDSNPTDSHSWQPKKGFKITKHGSVPISHSHFIGKFTRIGTRIKAAGQCDFVQFSLTMNASACLYSSSANTQYPGWMNIYFWQHCFWLSNIAVWRANLE